MQIERIRIVFRKPSVQYGFHEYEYLVVLDDLSDSSEEAIREIHKKHFRTIEGVEADNKRRMSPLEEEGGGRQTSLW